MLSDPACSGLSFVGLQFDASRAPSGARAFCSLDLSLLACTSFENLAERTRHGLSWEEEPRLIQVLRRHSLTHRARLANPLNLVENDLSGVFKPGCFPAALGTVGQARH